MRYRLQPDPTEVAGTRSAGRQGRCRDCRACEGRYVVFSKPRASSERHCARLLWSSHKSSIRSRHWPGFLECIVCVVHQGKEAGRLMRANTTQTRLRQTLASLLLALKQPQPLLAFIFHIFFPHIAMPSVKVACFSRIWKDSSTLHDVAEVAKSSLRRRCWAWTSAYVDDAGHGVAKMHTGTLWATCGSWVTAEIETLTTGGTAIVSERRLQSSILFPTSTRVGSPVGCLCTLHTCDARDTGAQVPR